MGLELIWEVVRGCFASESESFRQYCIGDLDVEVSLTINSQIFRSRVINLTSFQSLTKTLKTRPREQP